MLQKVNKNKWKIALTALMVILALALFSQNEREPTTWEEALRQYVGKPEYENIDPKKPLSEQTRTVEIAGRTFNIPIVYIDSNIGKKRVLPDGINLIYVLPDFTHRVDFKNRQQYDEAFRQHRFGHMLIQPATNKPPLSQMIKNSQDNEEMTKYDGKFYGLEKYSDFNSKKHPNIIWDDTYLEINSKGELISFLRCSPEGKDKVPGCSHHFVDKKLYYNIHYSKENYLPKWQEQRRKAIEFIDNFELKAKK